MINFSKVHRERLSRISSLKSRVFPQFGWRDTLGFFFTVGAAERILDRRPCPRRTSERNFHGSGGVAKSLKDLPACVVCGVRAPATEVVNANGVVHLLLRSRSRRRRRRRPTYAAARAIGERRHGRNPRDGWLAHDTFWSQSPKNR